MTEEEGETQEKDTIGKNVTERREEIGNREEGGGLPSREAWEGVGNEAEGIRRKMQRE
jgi:hypothetical protein